MRFWEYWWAVARSQLLGPRDWMNLCNRDERLFHGWRLQQNLLTGHFRLLDPDDQNIAWGSRRTCEAALARATSGENRTPLQAEAILVLHGLIRTRRNMVPLMDFLRARMEAYIECYGYPSSLSSISGHARSVSRVVAALRQDGVERVSFVGHSLGSQIIRAFLAHEYQPDRHPRLGRFVMLGPPNQGADIARWLTSFLPFHWLAGTSGLELGGSWPARQRRFPLLPLPTGVIAGGFGHDRGGNPLLRGDDDLLVRLAETQLDGVTMLPLRVGHGAMAYDPRVHRAVWQFLATGRFESREKYSPPRE